MVINLEMQVVNEGNWVDRSQSYLCRSFDRLNKGKNYADAIPAIQIGILNSSVFCQFSTPCELYSEIW